MKAKATIILTLIFTIYSVYAVESIGTNLEFNYQGQLLDNGSPANGTYDILISGYNVEEDGLPVTAQSEHLAVNVTNGLFTLTTVDLDTYIFGSNPYWLELSIRKSSVGASYEVLSPRQKFQAAPLARTLVSDIALPGYVLTFGSEGWKGAQNLHFSGDYNDLSNKAWEINGSGGVFHNGNVGIGGDTSVHPNEMLSIRGPASNLYTAYYEDGLYRGYVGSFYGNNEDFDIGSANTGRLLFTTDAAIRLAIDNDGVTNFLADTKQDNAKSGQIKYSLKASCDIMDYSISNYYNGTTTQGNATITALGLISGSCKIHFPTDLTGKTWQASAIGEGNKAVNCNYVSGSDLDCYVFFSADGTRTDGEFMLTIY